MTIVDLQKVVDTWIKNHGVRYFNPLTNTAILMEEVGEVARHMARIYGDQSYRKEEEEKRAQELLGDEMADVLFVLICLANQSGIDLQEAIKLNLEKKTNRDKERHKKNQKLL